MYTCAYIYIHIHAYIYIHIHTHAHIQGISDFMFHLLAFIVVPKALNPQANVPEDLETAAQSQRVGEAGVEADVVEPGPDLS